MKVSEIAETILLSIINLSQESVHFANSFNNFVFPFFFCHTVFLKDVVHFVRFGDTYLVKVGLILVVIRLK